ncbi:DUF2589 domain-containing protein [Ruminiclostridium herbifermentans]|uniref:DUF2589 domain-containing protein n=1 Tax=Ruminiclostridium herbifermentans TaxID=2488810 RepID=A0A4U7JAA9_9FIRM|nr:DUF2589 domain-containing protein [Ruminiclostridium herbifermentans]QNU66744.1 DUF2589 domain-containing protein [Ruminiclostridium herbifermentans]
MSIAQQFSGLPMDQLIGAPLSAASDASIRLASSTAEFINKVGFDSNGNVRNVAFKYEKRSMNEDGTSNLDEMKVEVPMLAIVPIPNLQIDEVNILFDMEVKQSEKSESSLDLGLSLSGSARIGPVKVSVTGSVSVHQANTRSTDNSAKYHVDVRATNHGTPEGLARVLDMMAANVAPSLVSSTLKDGNGQDLTEQAKAKAERLKSLRNEISQLESRLSAAESGLMSNIINIKKIADSQLNVYQSNILKKINELNGEDDEIKNAKTDEEKEKAQKKKEENDKLAEEYSQTQDQINQVWNNFKNMVKDYIKMIADSNEEQTGVSELFGLKAVDDKIKIAQYAKTEEFYNALAAAQKNAVDSQKTVSQTESDLLKKKGEYSNAIAGK